MTRRRHDGRRSPRRVDGEPTPTCPATATTATRSAATTSTWTTGSPATGWTAGPGSRRRGRGTLRRFTLDLAGLRGRQGDASTAAAAARFSQRGGKLTVALAAPVPAGERSPSTSSTPGTPAPAPQHRGARSGWEELTDGVIVAGQPDGAPSWFPCNDRPERQGELPHRGDHRVARTTSWPTALLDRARSGASRDDLGATSRPSRWRPTWPPSRSAGTTVRRARGAPVPQRAVVPAAAAARVPSTTSAGSREMMELFERAVRALPVRRLHRRRHRRRAGDPARGAGAVGVRRQPPGRPTGQRAAGRARAGAPVVRQQPDPRPLAATSGCTRASPATPSGCGPRSPAARRPTCRAPPRPASGWPRCRRTSCVGDPGPELMFDDRVYKRGALTLHALRLTVGRRGVLRASLRAWTREHAHGTVVTDDFVDLASRHSDDAAARALPRLAVPERRLPELPGAGHGSRRGEGHVSDGSGSRSDPASDSSPSPERAARTRVIRAP